MTTHVSAVGQYQAMADSKSQIDYDDMDAGPMLEDDMQGDMNETDDFDEGGAGSRRLTLLDMEAEKFDTSGITIAKLGGSIREDTLTSKETGIIYEWDSDITMWIPQVQVLPNITIPYSTINRDRKSVV